MAKKKGFKLTWDMPPAAQGTRLFRIDGAGPVKINAGQDGSPTVVGGKRLTTTKKGEYFDDDVQPGKTYLYAIFADYGAAGFAPKCTTVELTVPIAPDPVKNLKVVPNAKKGVIRISWTNPNPPGRWDSVVVTRTAQDGKSKALSPAKSPKIADADVRPGNRYSYAVHVQQGSLPSPAVSKECVLECAVSGFGGQYLSAKSIVKLNWKIPPAAETIHLYRSTGKKAPDVQKQGNRFKASDGKPPLLSKRADTHDDPDVVPGNYYTYVAIADFGNGIYAASDPVCVHVPRAPAPPTAAKANLDTDSILVDWKVSKDANSRYRVYRKQGADAPVSPADGDLIEETDLAQIRDRNSIVAGKWYGYSIFSVRGGLLSAKPASTKSTGALIAPRDVKATVQDNVVRITWKAPKEAEYVYVAVADGTPPKQFKGSEGKKLDPNGNFSETVPYGKTRGYRIACVYKGLDGRPHTSDPRIATVTVHHPTGRVMSFVATPDHGKQQIECKWDTDGVGQFRIYRLAREPGLARDSEHDLANLRMFQGVQPAYIDPQLGTWTDQKPDAARPWYCGVMVSPSGQGVRIGPHWKVGVVPKLGQLALRRRDRGVAMQFDWPNGIDAVLMQSRIDGGKWSKPMPIERDAHAAWGGELRWRPSKGPGLYHYRITPFRGDLRGEPCQIDHKWIGEPRLLHVMWEPSGRNMLFRWQFRGDPLPEEYPFGGVQLLGKANSVPLSNEDPDAFVLATSSDGTSANEIAVPLSEVMKKLGDDVGQAFFRAELVTPELDHGNVVLVQCGCSAVPMHFDTTQYVGQSEQKTLQKYDPKATDFFCPVCWTKYPVKDMLYADSKDLEGGVPDTKFRRAKRGVGKLLGRGGPPGRYKYCPGKEKHLQGIHAGKVPNRLIGMLGSSESGKTSYFASLLTDLWKKPVNSMDVMMSSLNDMTHAKSIELSDAHEAGIEHGQTAAGVGNYLSYLLETGDRHWYPEPKRSLLFSVQDTGGENMATEDDIRKNLPYLKECSGLILTIDPLQIPPIRQKLEGKTSLPEFREAGQPHGILDRLGNVLADEQLDKIPLAVVLTKCDVLLETGLFGAENLWGASNKTDRQKYSWDYHNDMTGLFAAFMAKHDPGTYRNVVSKLPVHAFFGVSAYGSSEQEAIITEQGAKIQRFVRVEPKHVLEPIWWLLATLDMIKTSRLKW